MTRADYRAEARAWRRAARVADAEDMQGPYEAVWRSICAPIRAAAEIRIFDHYNASIDLLEDWRHWLPARGGLVLACLILALEAEDDARRAQR